MSYGRKIGKSSIIILSIAAVIILSAIGWWMNGMWIIPFMQRALMFNGLPGAAFGLVLLFSVWAVIYWGAKKQIAAIVVTGLLGIFALTMGFTSGYRTAVYYSNHMKTIDSEVSYEGRAPWIVANNLATRDQGDIIGNRTSVRNVDNAPDKTLYTTVVNQPNAFTQRGFVAVQSMNMPQVGKYSSDITTNCQTPDNMPYRYGNINPFNNLKHQIYFKKWNANWDTDDFYGYCDEDGTPVFVQPLWKPIQFFGNAVGADGAAVYTKDGLQIMTAQELIDNKIQGPTYPTRVADYQSDAPNATTGMMNYYFGTVGYAETGEDNEDVNIGNTSNILLRNLKTSTYDYVTPLSPRKGSQSITAISSIDSRQESGKAINDLNINTSPDLPATSTIANSIKESSVRGDSEWTTRWASGMGIYEMVPNVDGTWTASIGQGQAVSYRATIQPDGSVNVKTTEKSTGKEKTETVAPKDTNINLSEMSDQEIYDLIRDAIDEVENR